MTSTPEERLWEAVKIVAGANWDYEAVPFKEVMTRMRYQHLRNALHKAEQLLSERGISAEQLAEVKNQCELGLHVEHECPAMFALAAIYAELFTNAAPLAGNSNLEGSTRKVGAASSAEALSGAIPRVQGTDTMPAVAAPINHALTVPDGMWYFTYFSDDFDTVQRVRVQGVSAFGKPPDGVTGIAKKEPRGE